MQFQLERHVVCFRLANSILQYTSNETLLTVSNFISEKCGLNTLLSVEIKLWLFGQQQLRVERRKRKRRKKRRKTWMEKRRKNMRKRRRKMRRRRRRKGEGERWR